MSNLIRYICSKLHSTRADTLVEALVALLIAALGATLLATMVMVSTNVTMTSRQALSNLYRAENSMTKSGVSEADFSFGKVDINVKVWNYQSTDNTGKVVFERYQNESFRPEDMS